MHCNMEGKSHDHGCLLMLTGSVNDIETAAVWEIPCGIEEHSGVVSAVTFISAVLSAFLIVLTSIYYLDIQKPALI